MRQARAPHPNYWLWSCRCLSRFFRKRRERRWCPCSGRDSRTLPPSRRRCPTRRNKPRPPTSQSYISRSAFLRNAPAPNEINGDAGQNEQITDAGRSRREISEIDDEERGQNHRDNRDDRVTPSAIRPITLRPFLSQDNNGDNKQDIKDEIGRDDVFEELSVHVAVAHCPGDSRVYQCR